jgi:glycine dehydrogenase subunit 1
MYMASLGASGLAELARLNHSKAEYLKEGLCAAGARIVFSAPTFNEFVVEFPGDFRPAYQRLLARKIVAGLELGRFYAEHAGRYLFCVTETCGREILDAILAEVDK